MLQKCQRNSYKVKQGNFSLGRLNSLFSVNLPTLEAHRMRNHVILYLFRVFFTRYEASAL